MGLTTELVTPLAFQGITVEIAVGVALPAIFQPGHSILDLEYGQIYNPPLARKAFACAEIHRRLVIPFTQLCWLVQSLIIKLLVTGRFTWRTLGTIGVNAVPQTMILIWFDYGIGRLYEHG